MIRNGLSRISLPAIVSSSSPTTAVSSLLDSTLPSYRTPTRFEFASVVDALDVDRQPLPKVAAEPTLLQPRVVIYDGVCHLCHRGVKWIIKKDKYKKIKFCCVQSKTAEPYFRLCSVDRGDVLKRFMFVEGPGAYYEGSTVKDYFDPALLDARTALKVASYLPFPYSALSAMLILPAPLRDAAYDYVAKHRYNWFGKEDECIVMQEKDLLERFIDMHELLDNGGGCASG
ncbi:hypothetical protein ZIOFF_075179 [Zingiber officinale]|uniref:Thiol-disulfide oxidoreductase DCC n=1 Tax=Zingiber officinale TaxID=94328 RepID=A0A8J5E8N7_ZINOF|nr:hypothetical protein ZIOFF_075179 [Zingiber officinale]